MRRDALHPRTLHASLVGPPQHSPRARHPSRHAAAPADRASPKEPLVSLFARKSIDALRADAFTEGEHSLKRALGPLNLVSLGIGAIIGTGIFVLTGSAAAQYAGNAIVISFIIAGIGCAFAGLCYAEFAAMIPIAGSAYTYGYATLGEFIAWIIGWDLILEYLFGASTVAVGWSGYFSAFLAELGFALPESLTTAPLTAVGHSIARDPGGIVN